MDERELFILSNRDLLPVIQRIRDEHWGLKAPPNITWKPDQSIRDLVNYHIYDDAWVPDVLAGKTAEEVGDRYEHLRTTMETAAEYPRWNRVAIDAVSGFSAMERIVHLSYGDYTAREYLTHVSLFRGLRNYDLATFLGFAHSLSPELAQGLYEIVLPRAALLREMHVIGAEIPVPSDAPLLKKFLALTGRG